jgi:hypothetical protein
LIVKIKCFGLSRWSFFKLGILIIVYGPDAMSKKLYLKMFFRNEYGEFVDRRELYSLTRIAVDPGTTPSRLKELSHHPNFIVRLSIAQNPNIALEILEQLTFDSHLQVAHQALRHPGIALDTLNRSPEFNKATNWRLRVMIARNLQTTLDVLVQLSEDDSAFVRYAVSRNPNTPQEVAAQAGDSSYFQQLICAGETSNNRKLLERLSYSHSIQLRKAVATNPNTPRRVMEVLLGDPSPQVRRELARNQNSPEYILKILSTDRYSCVRVSVAANATTPREIKLELCQDIDRRVQRVALKYTYTRPSSFLSENIDRTME